MHRPRLRPSLIALLAAWLAAIGLLAHMLLSAEISRQEMHFDEEVRLMLSDVKRKLDTNEAVLAGFSAFLQAVDRSDTDSTFKYAAAATAAYPHIYMIEIARKVGAGEAQAVQSTLRQRWRPDFSIKDFSDVTGRPPENEAGAGATWPIFFMYPSLTAAEAIYGVRLETVDYLSQTMALAQRNVRPVASPAFQMYEGGKAYILLQEVVRPADSADASQDIFGDTMMAMLLTRAEDLIPARSREGEKLRIGFTATLLAPGNAETLLFEREAPATGRLEQLGLPHFSRQLRVDNDAQPMRMSFQRQVLWPEILQAERVFTLALLFVAMIFVPWVTVRHYISLDRAEREHERSAYLATHDLLTDLPNRFLFADRFEHALRNWHRHGQSFALMLADLDNFKEINDGYGHEVGDQVLIACARRMTDELRGGDTVARHGGDEFVILLAEIAHAGDAELVGRKLLAAIAAPIETSAGPLTVSCSIGITICPTHGTTLDDLRKRADRAMYQAKDSGRNAVSVFSDEAS